jgi:hypothetical protein
VHREVPDNGNLKSTSTRKDLNLMKLQKENELLKFTSEDRDLILSNMVDDIEILKNHNLMDYSLLLAIERNPSYRQQTKKSKFDEISSKS